MKISDKVTVLLLAFEGLLARQDMKENLIMALYEFQDEIGAYIDERLTGDKIHFHSKLSELRDYTDKMFKSKQRPNEQDLITCIMQIDRYALQVSEK